MKILCINSTLAPAFRRLGATVKELDLPGGVIDLAKYPGVGEFAPDLIFQQESLGPRTLLVGLSKFFCPKFFWSIDTHLNFFWHKYYAKNFDLTFTTQPQLIPEFEREQIKACILPWYAPEVAFIDWDRRVHPLSFVGRLSEHRPVRIKFVKLLKQTFPDFVFAEDVAFEQMIKLYQQSKIVVNECIGGEINFRVFEATGSGSILLTPDLPFFDAFFQPEREVIVFSHALELVDKIKFYLKKTLEAEKIAKNAYNRVQKEHLALHRASFVVSKIGEEKKVINQDEEQQNVRASLFFLQANGVCPVAVKKHWIEEVPLFFDLEIENLLFQPQRLKSFLLFILNNNIYPQDLELNAVASEACLRIEEFNWAKLFVLRFSSNTSTVLNKDKLDDKVELRLFWARQFLQQNKLIRRGFIFDAEKHLPRSALEFIYLALEQNEKDKRVLRLFRDVCKRLAGQETLLLRAESWLSLLEPDNWRLNLDLVLTNLKNFRVKEAREEFYLAWNKAQKAGEEDLFWIRAKALGVASLKKSY
ncbi:MAG: glycosyltransferase [Desulfonauticus sp.]|nr:glycosyltransferase [Desulfonauticus sp.]